VDEVVVGAVTPWPKPELSSAETARFYIEVSKSFQRPNESSKDTLFLHDTSSGGLKLLAKTSIGFMTRLCCFKMSASKRTRAIPGAVV